LILAEWRIYTYTWGGVAGAWVVVGVLSARFILVNYHKVYKSVGLQVSQGLLSLWVNTSGINIGGKI